MTDRKLFGRLFFDFVNLGNCFCDVVDRNKCLLKYFLHIIILFYRRVSFFFFYCFLIC